MTVSELITILSNHPLDAKVCVWDQEAAFSDTMVLYEVKSVDVENSKLKDSDTKETLIVIT